MPKKRFQPEEINATLCEVDCPWLRSLATTPDDEAGTRSLTM